MPEAKEQEKWFGMRLTPVQKQRIERLAERKGTTQKDAVLDAVARELSTTGEDDEVEPAPGSFMEGIEDLAGSVDGPEDLSTNPKYLDDMGRSSLRARYWTPGRSSLT
jgi:hypothetical protein